MELKIKKKQTRKRLHAVVSPETLAWLMQTKKEQDVSLGELIDSMVATWRDTQQTA